MASFLSVIAPLRSVTTGLGVKIWPCPVAALDRTVTPRTVPVLASTRVRVTPSDPSATTDHTSAAFRPPRTDRVAPWTWVGSATVVFGAAPADAGAAAACRASASTRAEVVVTAAAAVTSGVVDTVLGTAIRPSATLTAPVLRAVWTA